MPTAIGFAGPLLASLPRLRVPVVVGELIAGSDRRQDGVRRRRCHEPDVSAAGEHRLCIGHVCRGHPCSGPRERNTLGVTTGPGAGGVGRGRRGGPGFRVDGGVRNRPRSALRGSDGLVVGGAGAAGDRFAAVAGTARTVRDCADRYCRCRLYCVAAVGDRRPTRTCGSTRCAGGSGLRGSALCVAARGRPQGLASAPARLLRSTGLRWNCGPTSSCCSRWRRWPSPPGCRSCWRASRWVWWSPRSASRDGWHACYSGSPRASSARCSSSGWALHCRYVIWVRTRNSSC